MTGGVLILLVTREGATSVERVLKSCVALEQGAARPVMIIDNASRDDTVGRIESLGLEGLEIRRLPKNLGVAKAYNMGLAHARAKGARWLFVLDQDSICGPSCLDRLLTTGTALIRRGEKVGAVCPTAKSLIIQGIIHYPYRWSRKGLEPVLGDDAFTENGLVPIDSTITSGTLYRVESLAEIGGFREEYFIDFVDHECHIRLRRAGWSLWWDRSAELYHCLGKRQEMARDGLWIEHEPYRYYYMARNMTEGYWRLGGLRALLHFGSEMARHMNRLRRLGEAPGPSIYFIFRGIKDALLGKTGPLDAKP